MKHRLGRLALAALFLASACEPATMPTALPDDAGSPSLATTAAPSPGAGLLSETTWGGADNDVTEGAAVAADGSTYLVGFTRSFDATAPELFTVKFGADGSLAWQRTWDGPGGFFSDEGRDAAVAPDGSVYVTGTTFVNGDGALLLKLSADGSLLWQRTWGGNARGEAVAVAADGSAYVVGATRSFGAGEEDLFVIKVAPDGTLLWFKTWGGAGSNEQGQGVAVGADGSVYVAGVAPRPADPFAFQFDAVLLKLDPAGGVLWQRAFPAGDQTDARGGVAVAPDGSAYVAGGFQGPSGSGFTNEGLVLSVAGDGTLLWARRWDGGFFEDMAVAPDGRVVLAGQTISDQGGDDAFVVRLNPDGRTSDAFTWGGAGLDGGRGVGVAPDGTVSLAAVAEQPPYVLADARARTSRERRMSATTPAIPLVDAAGALLADPAGVVETPAGSTTYAGGFEAALVRIAP